MVVLSKNGIFTTKNTKVMKIIYILLIYLIFVTFVSFVVKSFPIRRIKNDIFTEEHEIMLQNKSFHSLLKDFYIEIHQQANLFSREFHISQKLSLVDPQELIYCFQFNKQRVINQEINPVTTIQSNTLILHGQWNLSLKWNTCLRQFIS